MSDLELVKSTGSNRELEDLRADLVQYLEVALIVIQMTDGTTLQTRLDTKCLSTLREVKSETSVSGALSCDPSLQFSRWSNSSILRT